MAATHFTGPVVSTNGFRQGTGAVETITGATTLTASDSGKTFYLNAAAGATITLPAVAAGLELEFIVAATFATTNWIIDSAEGDNIDGSAEVAGAVVVAGAEDQINLVATAEALGDTVILKSDGNQWFVRGIAALTGGMTFTDPS